MGPPRFELGSMALSNPPSQWKGLPEATRIPSYPTGPPWNNIFAIKSYFITDKNQEEMRSEVPSLFA